MPRKTPQIEILPISIEDAVHLAKLHVAVWRATYKELAPPEAYQKLDENRRLPYWQNISKSEDKKIGSFVGKLNGQAVGVVSFGPSSHPCIGGAIEIKHLYVNHNAQGAGLGKRLLHAAFDHLHSADCWHIALAVVRENIGARKFYRALGGEECGEFIDSGPLWRSTNCIVRWNLSKYYQSLG